ncbi:MAG: hypothetical protein QXW06_03660, partial [Thermoplasmata archaeon]
MCRTSKAFKKGNRVVWSPFRRDWGNGWKGAGDRWGARWATMLNLSVYTVDAHRGRIMEKLNL